MGVGNTHFGLAGRMFYNRYRRGNWKERIGTKEEHSRGRRVVKK